VYCKTITQKETQDDTIYTTYDRILYSEKAIPHIAYDVQLAHKKYALRFCICAILAMSIPFFKRYLKSIVFLGQPESDEYTTLLTSIERFETSVLAVCTYMFEIKKHACDVMLRVDALFEKADKTYIGVNDDERSILKKKKKWDGLTELLKMFKNKKIEKSILTYTNRLDMLLFFLDRL
jgi:hypothetical protein